MSEALEPRIARLHGHDVSFRRAGSGPAVVLIHGITSTSATWLPVAPALAEHHTILAPDLLGHGASAKPKGDYSLGSFASGVRDLMVAEGIEHATVVGHSLGGGVAMQFAYQFPERCERLVLVDSGGLGREVSRLLRAATLPGSEIVIPLIASSGLLRAGRFVGAALQRVGRPVGRDVEEMARGHASLNDIETRRAFVQTLRGIVEAGGQRVDARDRLYLAGSVPTLLVWGGRDPMIPASHGREAHAAIPGSRLEVFEASGHFPHMEEPERFTEVLLDFLATTAPAQPDPERLRELLTRGAREAT